MTSASAPPPRVRAAFGVTGPAVRLAGGQGLSWRVGEVVLKPHVEPGFQEWLGTEVAAIEQHGFRLPAVRRALDGAWVVEGWAAQAAVPGSTQRGSVADWRSIIEASRALHAAAEALVRPAFLDLRTDPWARADRAAWGEGPRQVFPEVRELVARLAAAPAPTGAAQLVHGDLTDNVLLAPGQPPTIIDFSPYWRPPSYAEGIVIADALGWHRAPPGILEDVDVPLPAVARGLLFRLLTACRIHEQQGAALREETRRYHAVMTTLGL